MAKLNSSLSSLLALAVLWPRGAVRCAASARAIATLIRDIPQVCTDVALAAVWRLLRRQHQPWRRPLVFPCWLLWKRQLLSGWVCVWVVGVWVCGCVGGVGVGG